MIVRLEKEEFKVLTQHGKVRGRASVGGVGVHEGVGLAWCTAVAHITESPSLTMLHCFLQERLVKSHGVQKKNTRNAAALDRNQVRAAASHLLLRGKVPASVRLFSTA